MQIENTEQKLDLIIDLSETELSDKSYNILWDFAQNDPSEEVRSAAISLLGAYVEEFTYFIDNEDNEDSAYITNLSEEVLQHIPTVLRNFLFEKIISAQTRELERCNALEAISFDAGPEEYDIVNSWLLSKDVNKIITALVAISRIIPEDEAIWKYIIDFAHNKNIDIQYYAIHALQLCPIISMHEKIYSLFQDIYAKTTNTEIKGLVENFSF